MEVTEAYEHNDFISQNKQKNIIGWSWKNTDTIMKTQSKCDQQIWKSLSL